MKSVLLVLVISAFTYTALADKQSPYLGQENRDIKALSEQEIDSYLAGDGMGYAKAAELNQYPGPKHVLELADDLSLTQEQASKTQAIFDAMKTAAIDYGQKLIKKEQELDSKFASKTIDADTLEMLLSAIGSLESKIRFVHLSAHIKQKYLLSKSQIMLYDRLRGYGVKNHGEHKLEH